MSCVLFIRDKYTLIKELFNLRKRRFSKFHCPPGAWISSIVLCSVKLRMYVRISIRVHAIISVTSKHNFLIYEKMTHSCQEQNKCRTNQTIKLFSPMIIFYGWFRGCYVTSIDFCLSAILQYIKIKQTYPPLPSTYIFVQIFYPRWMIRRGWRVDASVIYTELVVHQSRIAFTNCCRWPFCVKILRFITNIPIFLKLFPDHSILAR